ncbi:MAG TPA: diguanylate cyclase [Albitalea sp.]|nr:diguanylate cyclase [Albitalea sp.]
MEIATVVLGSDRHQRIRLLQTGIATLLMCACALGVNYLAWVGAATWPAAAWWTSCTLGAFAGFLLFIRLGFNRGFADPSLTIVQMVTALASGVWAYAITGAGRGAVFPAPIVVLMFGMYALQPATVRRIGWLAVAMYGLTMLLMSSLEPAVYAPSIEVVHFFVLAAMLMSVAMLAGQLSRLRERLRTQKAELGKALERIQDLATRDELTGLVNRRYMQEVLAREHQRCMRSGHSFCVTMIDLDHFKQINDHHGHAAGDAVLRAFAAEARAAIRGSDVLARWGGEEFLLLMTDTRAPLGRLGVERLRERVAAMRVPRSDALAAVTFSAGLAEHRAGEPLAETISRADHAMYAAKAQGRNRVVVA